MGKKRFYYISIAFILFALVCSPFASAKIFAKDNKSRVSYSEKKSNPLSEDTPYMFEGYMREMQNKIKSNWEPPQQYTSKSVVISYTIMKDGKLGSYKIIQSSENNKMDKAAVKALKKSAPFEPLPANFLGDHVEVQFTFDYNVFKNGKKQ